MGFRIQDTPRCSLAPHISATLRLHHPTRLSFAETPAFLRGPKAEAGRAGSQDRPHPHESTGSEGQAGPRTSWEPMRALPEPAALGW